MWKKVKIGDVYEGLYDGPHATPPTSDDGAIFLGISNITKDGHINLSDIKYINENDLPKWTKRVTPRGGDIVFSYEATLNLYAIIPDDFWGCLGRRMALIRPDETKAHGKYLYYYFFSEEWRSTIYLLKKQHSVCTRSGLWICVFRDMKKWLSLMACQRGGRKILLTRKLIC